MASGDYAPLVDLARTRYGVVTDQEAAELGFSEGQIRRKLEAGLLTRPAPGILVVGAAPATWEQQVAVATLSLGGEAVASHMTAAALWGMLNTSGGRLEVAVHRWDRCPREFVVHESLDLADEDRTVLKALPITTPVRTLVDLGAVFPSAVEEAFERGRRANLVALDDVVRLVKRVGRQGRRGVGPARELIRVRRLHPDRTESTAEDIYLRITRLAGMPEPIQQYEIYHDGWFVCRADFAYPHEQVVVLIDGFAYHVDAATFQKDRSQQNQLGLIGWHVLRFTYRDLVERPHLVVLQVRKALSLPVSA